MSKVAHTFQDKSRTGDVIISESVDFSNLLLSAPVLNGLKNAGFVRPSPIQLKAIPLGRCGLDLIVQAKSGTGKTCVFSVIGLESIVLDSASLQVLVLAPTREIAVQIWEVINSIGSAVTGLQCHTFIGGMPLHEDRMKLKKCHIAVGSPGRIKQLIESGELRTDSIRLFILDEADKLLEESFQEQINWIYSTLPENKQMLALSATYPEYLAEHLTAYMRNPTFLRLNITDPALLGIRQYYQTVAYHPMSHVVFEEKTKVLSHILSSISFQQCLVFSNLQTRAQMLADTLNKAGWPTTCIAGCLDQTERNLAMAQLKTYKCRVLISTDLTSRGIDADKVNLVINMDVPKDHETYLHRIGRAGRFGSFGIAITVVSEGQERMNMNSIEKRCNTQIHPLPDPIPSDLAKPDCPIFLDDVVSSEVINTDEKRQSLPKSPRRNEKRQSVPNSPLMNKAQSPSMNIDKQERETNSANRFGKVKSFPYTCIHNSKSEDESSIEQTNPVSDNPTVSKRKMCGEDLPDVTVEKSVVNGSHKLNENLANENIESDKLNSERTLNHQNTKMPFSKSNFPEVDNSDKAYKHNVMPVDSKSNLPDCVTTTNGEILDKEKLIEMEVESVKSSKVPKFYANTVGKGSDKWKSSAVMDIESNISFSSLENLNITDIIQHNIGYKKLSKCNTYKSARESLMEFRHRKQNMSDDGMEISEKLQTYCRVPDSEHSDTETLRNAVARLQNIQECRSSSLVSNPAGDDHPSDAGNVCSSVAESTGDVHDDIIDNDNHVDTDKKPEEVDTNAAEVHKPEIESSGRLSSDVVVLDSDVATVKKVEGNSKPEGNRELDSNTRRKRYGYRGNFAIGHLLQQERGQSSYHNAGETSKTVQTCPILDFETEIIKELKPAESMSVEESELLVKSMDTLSMESGYGRISEDSKLPGTMTNWYDYDVSLEETPAESAMESSMNQSACDYLTSYGETQDTGKHYEISSNKGEVHEFGIDLASHCTETEGDMSDISETESESSSDASDSDTDSECSSENNEETDSDIVHKQNRRFRQGIDGMDSLPRSLASNSSDRTCDSGVYSRQSYQDYCRQWYNDWYTYCMSQQQGWTGSNPTWPLGYYGNQYGYPPSAYNGGQTVYNGGNAAGMPQHWPWDTRNQYMHPQHGPSNQHHVPSNQQWHPSNQHHAPNNQQLYPSNQHYVPSNEEWYPYGDYRSSFYPTTQTLPPADQSSSNSPESMQDVFKFQSEYIKEMCSMGDSRNTRENGNRKK